MNIPKKFKLGGVTWKVEEVDALGGSFGQTELWDAKITIVGHLKPDVKAQTFLHELIHAVLFSMGKRNHDEELVDGMATLLHQYLDQQK